MKGYVRRGSGAEAGHPQKSTFRFYSRMQFLDEAGQETPTTSSLPQNICRDEDNAQILNDLEFEECNVYSPITCSTPDNPERAGSSANCRPRKKKEDSSTIPMCRHCITTYCSSYFAKMRRRRMQWTISWSSWEISCVD
ncbi:uncharacterized protein [Temnothorax longispinosus]|uniref:uncharacterized protein n=1 Tax=Temnothorax longispinosus TaxID=300112 RepID=UPI003A99C10C